MLFNSFEFLVFLPIVFLLYWFVIKQRRLQNLFLLIVSYIFYGWWNWRFLFLIALISTCSFLSGLIIERLDGSPKAQKWVSATNVILNIAVLGVFKYFNFFSNSLEILFNCIGWKVDFVTLNIVLPVGISFYTFQALSYSIDVYRGKIKATHNPIDFFAFIGFFPQLIAGPIERATNLLPQFQNNRTFHYGKAVDGCRQMLWGFFKKMVVADMCAVAVDSNWDLYCTLPCTTILFLGILFNIQVYCDFSAYSDIAIGCAKLFGFDLMKNFNVPFFSRNISEYWTKWHISLSTWFRDYIYFPLGGSRCSKLKTIRNLFVVFAISGLWHGANWTFVCWGLYHALLVSLPRIFNINVKYKEPIAYQRILPTVKETMQLSITFFLVVVGRFFYRAESMSQAIDIFYSMMHNPFWGYTIGGKTTLIMCFVLFGVEWVQRDKQHALQLEGIKLFNCRYMRWLVYYTILISIFYNSQSERAFIYFQF